jgi:esterase
MRKSAMSSGDTRGGDDQSNEDFGELRRLQITAKVAGIQVPVVVPKECQVDLHGMRFHYLDWGGTGRPIVFLHGGGLNAHTFDMVCLALHQRYRCLALDQRGHGDSEWSPTGDYGYEPMAADLLSFIDHLALDKLMLVGMSMGGQTSIAFATSNPDRLGALILIDTGPYLHPAGVAKIREFMSQPPVLDTVDDFVARALAFNPHRQARLLRMSLLNNLRQLPDGRWTWKWDPRRWTLGREDQLRLRRAMWDSLDMISCPTLIVRGAGSDVLLEKDARQLAARFPDGRYVTVERAGHTVQGDNPAGLAHELLRFCGEIRY